MQRSASNYFSSRQVACSDNNSTSEMESSNNTGTKMFQKTAALVLDRFLCCTSSPHLQVYEEFSTEYRGSRQPQQPHQQQHHQRHPSEDNSILLTAPTTEDSTTLSRSTGDRTLLSPPAVSERKTFISRTGGEPTGFIVLNGSSSPPSNQRRQGQGQHHQQQQQQYHMQYATLHRIGSRETTTTATASLSSETSSSFSPVPAPAIQSSQTFDSDDDNDDNVSLVPSNLMVWSTDETEPTSHVSPNHQSLRDKHHRRTSSTTTSHGGSSSASEERSPIPSLSTLRLARQARKSVGGDARDAEIRKLQTGALPELAVLKKQKEGYRC